MEGEILINIGRCNSLIEYKRAIDKEINIEPRVTHKSQWQMSLVFKNQLIICIIKKREVKNPNIIKTSSLISHKGNSEIDKICWVESKEKPGLPAQQKVVT